MSTRPNGRGRRRKEPPLEADFGPEPWSDPGPADVGPGERSPGRGTGSGPLPGIPCGGDGCLLKPVADLVARFAAEIARRGHTGSVTHAAWSGVELLRALRDFLDEEIAYAERMAEARKASARYSKIPID